MALFNGSAVPLDGHPANDLIVPNGPFPVADVKTILGAHVTFANRANADSFASAYPEWLSAEESTCTLLMPDDGEDQFRWDGAAWVADEKSTAATRAAVTLIDGDSAAAIWSITLPDGSALVTVDEVGGLHLPGLDGLSVQERVAKIDRAIFALRRYYDDRIVNEGGGDLARIMDATGVPVWSIDSVGGLHLAGLGGLSVQGHLTKLSRRDEAIERDAQARAAAADAAAISYADAAEVAAKAHADSAAAQAVTDAESYADTAAAAAQAAAQTYADGVGASSVAAAEATLDARVDTTAGGDVLALLDSAGRRVLSVDESGHVHLADLGGISVQEHLRAVPRQVERSRRYTDSRVEVVEGNASVTLQGPGGEPYLIVDETGATYLPGLGGLSVQDHFRKLDRRDADLKAHATSEAGAAEAAARAYADTAAAVAQAGAETYADGVGVSAVAAAEVTLNARVETVAAGDVLAVLDSAGRRVLSLDETGHLHLADLGGQSLQEHVRSVPRQVDRARRYTDSRIEVVQGDAAVTLRGPDGEVYLVVDETGAAYLPGLGGLSVQDYFRKLERRIINLEAQTA